MEEMEESSEIFEDCNNKETRQEDSNIFKLNENCSESEVKQQQQESEKFLNCDTKINNNNNHHVVPVGIIILLMTIYLGMTSVHKCLVSCVEQKNTVKDQSKQMNQDLLSDLYKPANKDNSIILERLLEYKDICKDLEIFTKNKNLPNKNFKNKQLNYEIFKQIENIKDGAANAEDGSSFYTDNNEASGARGDASGSGGSCVKETRNKNKKSKYFIKSSGNTKNGFNKYNKSSKAKYNKNNNKKELNLNKKNSTAEPIIYLFALVFIYLLLKAASDINQHYKAQNKNDKRLRRCSLQSYAQTHRPDRRASKGISTKSLPKF